MKKNQKRQYYAIIPTNKFIFLMSRSLFSHKFILSKNKKRSLLLKHDNSERQLYALFQQTNSRLMIKELLFLKKRILLKKK